MPTRPKSLLLALTVSLACACADSPGEEAPADGDEADKSDASSASSEGATNDGGSASATADAATSSGPAGSADCTGDMPADEKDLIATFEDQTVGVNPAGGWVGGFYIFNDKNNDPAQTGGVQPMSRCSDGSSQFAYCSKGTGFVTWGAGFGTDLGAVDATTMSKATVDLSAYSGISFWVIRNGASAMPATAKLILADENTSDEGGECSNAAEATANMKCDPFTTSVPLTSSWTKQTVMFSKLKQGGWGKPVTSFTPKAVYGVQLQFAPGVAFDVCFDQLTLIR